MQNVQNQWLFLVLLLISLLGTIAHAEPAPEIFVQLGHSSLVNSAAFSPDGKFVLSGSSDNTLKLWEVSSGYELFTFKGHSDNVNAVVFSPDGKTALSGSFDNTLKLWDVFNGYEIRTFKGHTSTVWSVAFSPDGKTALSGSQDNTLKLWDVASGRIIRTLRGHSNSVNAIAFSPDGKTALSGSDDKSLKLWNITNGHEIRTLEGHSEVVLSVAFSPDGKTALSGGKTIFWSDGLKLWDIASEREIHSFGEHSHWVFATVFSPTGKMALSDGPAFSAILWDVASGRKIRTLVGHSTWVLSVAFSPDGKTALSGSGDKTLKLWDVASGREIRTLGKSFNFLDPRALFLDHLSSLTNYITNSQSDKKNEGSLFPHFMRLYFYQSAEGKKEEWGNLKFHSRQLLDELASSRRFFQTFYKHITGSFQGHLDQVGNFAFSLDNKRSLSVDFHTFRLLDVAAGWREIFNFEGYSSPLSNLGISPDGKSALVPFSGKNEIKLLDVENGHEIHTYTFSDLNFSNDELIVIRFSPNGKTALLGINNTLRLLDTVSGRVIHTFQLVDDSVVGDIILTVAFSPDGKTALSGGATIKLWDVSSSREIRTLKVDSSLVTAAAFSPDGKTVLSGSRHLKLWNTSSGRVIRTFKETPGMVLAVAFSYDGKTALSISTEGTGHLWNIQTGEEIAQLFAFEDGEWVTIIPQGYYDTSAGGEKYINVRVGNKVTSVEPYRAQFKRPDLVKVVLETGEIDTTPPRIVLHQKQRSIRNELVIDTHNLRGQAIDKSGIASVTVNGQAASLDKYGYFSFELPIEANPVQVQIAATDIFDNTRHKKLTLSFKTKPASGNYRALVIGINRYPYLNDPRFDLNLDTAVNDAREVAEILQKNYGFTVKTLINEQASRRGILQAYGELVNKAKKDDHLLIYYAGHGYRDTKMDKAYWLPADAEHDEYTWIIADRITGYMKRSQAKNILVVSDSCYSGGLAKTRNYMPWWQINKSTRQSYLKRMKQENSRILISSGGNHPVSDSGGDGHSIFAQAFLDGLRQSNGEFTAEEILLYVKQRVAGTSNQVPSIYFIKNSGHRGGDFVFEGR